MKWPHYLMLLAYVLIAISFLGFGLAAVEGVRAAYIKSSTPTPALPDSRDPTEQELKLLRLESQKVKWDAYADARDRADLGLLIGFPSIVLGVAIGIFAGMAGKKKGYL